MAEIRQLFKSLSVLFVLSCLFTLSMFYRVSTAVIAPNLVKDLGLDAQTLGFLGGAFFYSFALFQIPVGPMLDRIGPRIVIGSLSIVGGLGSLLFAFGQSFSVALLGRILNGIGMACMMMGAFKVFTLRYPPHWFSTLVGILLAVGTLGNILATSPLAFVASTVGWRTAFIVAGGMTVILAVPAFWILEKGAEKNPTTLFSHPHEEAIGVFQSIRLIVKTLAFWQIGLLSFFRYGSYVSLQGLWLGPYLMEIKKYSPVQTGNILIMLALGTTAGGPIAGRLSDRTFQSSKGVVIAGLTLYSLSLFPLVGLFNIGSSFWYGVVFFSLGFFNAFGMVVYAHARDLFPIGISGTVMGLVNFFSMAGGAILMPAMGRIIESFPRVGSAYPAGAYHLSFLICFVGMTASLVFYGFSKER